MLDGKIVNIAHIILLHGEVSSFEEEDDLVEFLSAFLDVPNAAKVSLRLGLV